MTITVHLFVFTFIALTLLQTRFRRRTLRRNSTDWLIDGFSNLVHLIGLPLLQTYVLLNLYQWAFPQLASRWELGLLGSFLLYVLIDYLWYWNHRLLHSYTWVWNLHAVHHSAVDVDVFTTPRNSLWSHFFEVYIWFISFAVFALEDPTWFLTFAGIGMILNFWTHTEFTFSRQSRLYHWVSAIIVTPHEHLWHHSTSHANTNYATVFSLWDKLHGTWYSPADLPEKYGNDYLPGAFRQIFFPVPPRTVPNPE